MSDGSLKLGDTVEARRVADANSKSSGSFISLPPQTVLDHALVEVRRLGGDVDKKGLVLGQHKVQFGKYRGQTFKWMVENCLGYASYIVEGVSRETLVDTPLSHNKFKFKVK